MRALQLLDDRRLEITDIPAPEKPGFGEVTVNIKAVALNHIDVWAGAAWLLPSAKCRW